MIITGLDKASQHVCSSEPLHAAVTGTLLFNASLVSMRLQMAREVQFEAQLSEYMLTKPRKQAGVP